MSQNFLGEFEQMVLLSIMRLDNHAYGLAIGDELEAVAGRKPSSGSLYTTLDRMEKKGLVESLAGESSQERGGRPTQAPRARRKATSSLSGSCACPLVPSS